MTTYAITVEEKRQQDLRIDPDLCYRFEGSGPNDSYHVIFWVNKAYTQPITGDTVLLTIGATDPSPDTYSTSIVKRRFRDIRIDPDLCYRFEGASGENYYLIFYVNKEYAYPATDDYITLTIITQEEEETAYEVTWQGSGVTWQGEVTQW
jgi:hypothetical protein